MNLPYLGKAGYVVVVILLVGAIIVLAIVYRNIQLDQGTSALKSQNYGEAMKTLKPLAELGDSTSQYLLGEMFAFGYGVKQDDEQAMYWFRRAGRMWGIGHGYTAAGAAYYVGEKNVARRNYIEAVKWYRVAAEGGYRQAATTLSKAYDEGSLGLQRDFEQARYWNKKAEGRK